MNARTASLLAATAAWPSGLLMSLQLGRMCTAACWTARMPCACCQMSAECWLSAPADLGQQRVRPHAARARQPRLARHVSAQLRRHLQRAARRTRG